MLDFNGSTIFMSPRSPFARRVRLALRELGIRHEESHLDVLKAPPELILRNPLQRVPAVELASGQVLFESALILELLHESHPSRLFPRESKVELLLWGALAAGVCEKIVERYFDTMRPEPDPELER